MANDVTTGQELNSYTGRAALGGSDAAGYAALDISPLGVYALKKYETNLIDYNQQQADKKALQAKFTDPSLYLFLDKEYSDQVNPKLDRLKELSKKNLQMDPTGEDWYEFHRLYNEITQDNAGLKTVQALKDKYKKAAEDTADIHEKERLDQYVKQLSSWKLGQEIPSYNKYFGPNRKHHPDLTEETGTYLKPGGSEAFPTQQKVKYSIKNPINAFELARYKVVTDPTALQTGSDYAHTFLEMGGMEEVNESAKDIYKKALRLNISKLEEKYKNDYKNYERIYPGATFRDFMNNTGNEAELQVVYDKLKPLNDGLQAVPIAADNGVQLKGYTYYTDPKTKATVRMNLSDAEMLGFMAATDQPTGRKEEIVEEKFASEVLKARQEAADDATRRRGQTLEYRAKMADIARKKDEFKKLHPEVDIPEGEFGNLIYGVNGNVGTPAGTGITSLKNGTAVDKNGNIVKDFSGTMTIPANMLNNSIVIEYNKYAGNKSVTKTEGESKDEETGTTTKSSTTQTEMAGQLDLTSGKVRAKFENGVIKGIYAKDGTLIDDDMFKHITRSAGLSGVTKYKPADKDYGGKPATDEIPTLTTKAEFDALPKGAFYYRDGKKYQK